MSATLHAKVVFRRWKDEPRTLIALFPEYAANHMGDIVCYEHHGQHGSADYKTVLRKTERVTAPQAQADGLYQELKARGYVMDVRMLWSNHWKLGEFK